MTIAEIVHARKSGLLTKGEATKAVKGIIDRQSRLMEAQIVGLTEAKEA